MTIEELEAKVDAQALLIAWLLTFLPGLDFAFVNAATMGFRSGGQKPDPPIVGPGLQHIESILDCSRKQQISILKQLQGLYPENPPRNS